MDCYREVGTNVNLDEFVRMVNRSREKLFRDAPFINTPATELVVNPYEVFVELFGAVDGLCDKMTLTDMLTLLPNNRHVKIRNHKNEYIERFMLKYTSEFVEIDGVPVRGRSNNKPGITFGLATGELTDKALKNLCLDAGYVVEDTLENPDGPPDGCLQPNQLPKGP